MINVKTYEEKNSRKFTSHIEGTISDIFKDMCHIVRGVYDAIKKSNQSDAEDFKELMLIALNDPQFWSLDNSADETLTVDLSEIKSGGHT